jgi:ketosteroid isomerase-like protein
MRWSTAFMSGKPGERTWREASCIKSRLRALDDPTRRRTWIEALLEQYHRALGELINGNPDVYKSMFSQSEEVTLGNPFGPFARGREAVERRLEGAASNYQAGELTAFDQIAKYETAELAYLAEVERFKTKVGKREDLAPIALRVTSIFRPEDGGWQVVHRHADPIDIEQPAESVLRT